MFIAQKRKKGYVLNKIQDIVKILKENGIKKIETNVDLKKFNTWKIGGEVEVVVYIETQKQLEFLISFLKKEQKPFFILGNGSNTLFPDKKINAVGIKLKGQFSTVSIDGNIVTVGAGASMPFLASQTGKYKLTGMEFASGIPGSVGGSLVMNAGANGREMKNDLLEVTVLRENGEIKTLSIDQLNFSYRCSGFMKNKDIILFATYKLKNETKSAKLVIADIKKKRFETQPYEMPCAGSVFKNPEGDYAGRIIEELGMKGMSVGGASVSKKHANFIVNDGTAMCIDVKTLIELIQNKVKKEKGILLKKEVRYFGEGDLIKWK